MQAHTLGEVGNLCTVLLRVYSGTVLPIFIEIGLYLTDKQQNTSCIACRQPASYPWGIACRQPPS